MQYTNPLLPTSLELCRSLGDRLYKSMKEWLNLTVSAATPPTSPCPDNAQIHVN